MTSAYVSVELRRFVAARSEGYCSYCRSSESIIGVRMDVDHIIPTALGGPTTEDNLCAACARCNVHKGERISAVDPEGGERVPLFNPLTEVWAEHFEWLDSGVLIGGKTPKGRATVLALWLNRSPLVHARRAWVAVGWHPPKD